MTEDDERKQFQAAENIKKSSNENVDFETAIGLTGNGRYHTFFFWICGLISLANGFQNGLSSYVLPSAQCDLHLDSMQMGSLNAALMFGSTASAMLWGIVADSIGRKKILVWTLAFDGVFTLFSSLSLTVPIFWIFRFLNGFVVGASGTVIYSYMGEFYTEKEGTKAILLTGSFWTLSWIILPAFAWILIPLPIGFPIFGITFNSWRLFVAFFALPSLTSAALLSSYPESPKFLLTKGEHKKALDIMRQIFSTNTRKPKHEYPVVSLAGASTSDSKGTSFSELAYIMWSQLRCLFSPSLLKHTILCSSIMFALVFGYFGLALWFPELFNRFETHHRLHPNSSVTVCELMALRTESKSVFTETVALQNVSSDAVTSLIVNATASSLSNNSVGTCDASIDPKVFMNTIAIGAACLIANFIPVYLTNLCDSRILTSATMTLAGILACLIYFLRSSAQNLIVASLYSACLTVAAMIVTGLIVNVFPTSVNALAISMVSFIGRIGAITSNLLFGLLLDVSCETPIFLIGGLLVFGGILGLFIPKNSIQASQPEDKILYS